jgi:hypothetical protein
MIINLTTEIAVSNKKIGVTRGAAGKITMFEVLPYFIGLISRRGLMFAISAAFALVLRARTMAVFEYACICVPVS